MRRAVIALIGAALLVVPAAAQAHVSLHPNVLPVGANATVDLRVPNEMDNANTTKIQIELPAGFLDVSTQPPPGWTSKVLTTKLAKPVQTDDGPVTTQVSQLILTARSGGGITPGHFADFPMLFVVPGRAGQQLTFKTVQTYSNGKVARWIGAQTADQPAPWVDVTAKGGVLEDVAGAEAGPGPLPASGAGSTSATPPAAAKTTTVVQKKSSSSGLSIAALIVGLLALALGGGALVAARGTGTRGRAAA
ncbi:MAG: hypothetical protein QOJ82_1694 [Solirubrobacteraceae bacterium]|jgi:uncharacterized protein YcnI|nr:hypothetical protein [Solirubrobacteraceae bacterium]MEA2393803.1 hypothetical protein [Solirubrobacteraceae bacterium]